MSGIYLKGLKTPEKNPITVFIYPSGKCYCLANNIKDIDTFRLLKTEAVQVPDHGRLEVDNINLTGWLAEEHAKHQWIPVSERLPEKYTRVLVYSKRIRLGRNIDFMNEDGDWHTIPEVSYWMPLPEPPKDGEA